MVQRSFSYKRDFNARRGLSNRKTYASSIIPRALQQPHHRCGAVSTPSIVNKASREVIIRKSESTEQRDVTCLPKNRHSIILTTRASSVILSAKRTRVVPEAAVPAFMLSGDHLIWREFLQPGGHALPSISVLRRRWLQYPAIFAQDLARIPPLRNTRYRSESLLRFKLNFTKTISSLRPSVSGIAAPH